MSSLRLALKQSLEESGVVPPKLARDRDRKRAEAEFRKKRLKQQHQQQRRKPGDPPRKRGRPPKNRALNLPPHHDLEDAMEGHHPHDDDSSEMEATFSSDDEFTTHDDADSHREESSSQHSDPLHDQGDEDHDAKAFSTGSTTSNSSPNSSNALPESDHVVEDEARDFFHDDDDSDFSGRDSQKKLQTKQVLAANTIRNHWKKKRSLVGNENLSVEVSSTEDHESRENTSMLPALPLSSPSHHKSVAPDASTENVEDKKQSGKVLAKTVPPPSKDLIEWMISLPKKKLKRHIAPGLRVKVRFAARVKRDGKSIKKLKWYGGVVSKVAKEGSKIRIKYDDGTSEISPFPDPDVIVDDTANGKHEVPAEKFVPHMQQKAQVNPPVNEDLSLSTAQAKQPSPESSETAKVDRPTSPPKKKMKRMFPLVKESDRPVKEIVTPEVSELDVAEARQAKIDLRSLPDQSVAKVPDSTSFDSNAPVEATYSVDEPRVPVTKIDGIEYSDTKVDRDSELGKLPGNSHQHTAEPAVHVESTPREEIFVEEQHRQTSETIANPELIRISETPVETRKTELVKVPSLTLRLPKQHVPSVSRERSNENPFMSQKPKELITSGYKLDGDVAEPKSSLVSPEPSAVVEKSRSPPVNEVDDGNDQRPVKRIHIRLDGDTTIERRNTSNQVKPSHDVLQPDSEPRLPKPKDSKNLQASSVQRGSISESSSGSHLRSVEENDNVPAQIELPSKQRHNKNLHRSTEEIPPIKPRQQSPVCRPTALPKLVSTDSSNDSSEAHSTIGILSATAKNDSIACEMNVRKTPFLSGSKNSAFTKKESVNENNVNPVELNVEKDTSMGDDDGSSDTNPTTPRPRNNSSGKGSGARSGRRAANQVNQRLATKQDAAVPDGVVGKKKRKRDKGDGKKRDEEDESESSEDDRQWVMCDRCRKWRILPSNVESSTLPSLWYCDMNIYDPRRSSCSAPEQTAAECARERKRNKKRMRQRAESPEVPNEIGSSDEPPRKDAKNESFKGRIMVRSPVPRVERESMTKGPQKPEHDVDNKIKRPPQPDSNLGIQRSPAPDGAIEHHKAEKRTSGFNGKKGKTIEVMEGTSSSEGGGLDPLKAKSRGRGRSRITKEIDKDPEKPVGGGGGKAASQDAMSETDNVEWVQCEKCDKWRKLPAHISASELPDVWYCSMNTWNSSSASCDAAEDKADGYTHELSILGGSPSSATNKLSYRNLIFGTGKKFNRPISERTRAQESLFAVPAEDNDGYPTVMYANSRAFVPRSGLRGAVDQGNNGSYGQMPILELMKHSTLWAELRGVSEKLNAMACNRQPYQAYASFEMFPDDMKRSMKELVCQSLGTRSLSGHEVLLEAQSRQWENSPPVWNELRPYCTMDVIVDTLVELVKEGVVEIIQEPGVSTTSHQWPPRYRRRLASNRAPSTEGEPHLSFRSSRCMKISKPWKKARSQSADRWIS